jgi:hypothetical protein
MSLRLFTIGNGEPFYYFSLMDQARLYKLVKFVTLLTLAFAIICGFAMTFWEIHPFFLDEWAIIYNLKYKTATELWGGLDKTQQFPRLYLQIIKQFTQWFNYSYTSLRLPSFIVHCCGLAYCISLSKKLYGSKNPYRWLWVLVYVAYPSSVFYFVLTKQYTMEMLLALVGIAQLIILLNISSGKEVPAWKYTLLCLSFLVAPLFSYTYPMVAAPIFGIVLIDSLAKRKHNLKQWFPLILCAAGIVALYLTDIRQVQRDQGMKNYWKDYYMTNGFNLKELLYHIYMYFYLFGRGPFMHFLAFTGICAWLFGSYRSVVILRKKEKTIIEWLVLYCASLIWLSVILFIAGKLPLNAHRLNAYKTPAAATLIVYLFMQMQGHARLRIPAYAIAGVLFALQILFIVQPLVRDFTEGEHHKKMRIYNNAKTAIAVARQDRIPIFTTSMTLYPHQDIDQADWVIKSYPAYRKEEAIPVYPINTGNDADSLLHTLPYSSAVVTTGDSVFVMLNHD